MNNEHASDLLGLISELRQRYPDWRLGQLVANVSGWADREVWDVEDAEFMEAARLHLEQLRVTAAPLASQADR